MTAAAMQPWRRWSIREKATATRIGSRTLCLQRNKALGAIRGLGLTLLVELKPRNFRSCGRATAPDARDQRGTALAIYLRGWKSYFGYCQTPSVLRKLEAWIRRRLRSVIWKQWKRGTVRFEKLRQRNIGADLARQTAGSAHGPWRLSDSPALQSALSVAYFDSLGRPRLSDVLA